MKITIDLNVNAIELADAIKALSAALTGSGVSLGAQVNQPQPAQVIQFPQVSASAQPIQPQQTAPTAPPQAPPTSGVPTSTQAYTMDQLAVAATTIIDAGRRQEVVQLLAQFGAPSLMLLPKEQYGAFATALRSIGAKI